MARAFVTGGTGFVGINLVEALLAAGWDVTAMHRTPSDLTFLGATGCRLVPGDVVDGDSVVAAMPDGVEAVFHVAGSVNLWSRGNARQTAINVDGTRNVVRAALRRGAGRLVHTSSVGAFAAEGGTVIDETTPSRARGHWINYMRSKWEGEGEVRKGIDEGLDAVIMNPGSVMGPYDTDSWGRVFPLLAAGKIPAVPPGGGPFAHVHSVAKAHIRAYEVGRKGENYLLGSVHALHRDVFRIAAELLGVRVPPRAPRWVLLAIGAVSVLGSAVTGKAPAITPEIAASLSDDIRIDCSKAERELDYRETTLEAMVRDSFEWARALGRV